MANTIVLLAACCLLSLPWQVESTFPLGIARKPILNYLIRYKLGLLKSKAHGLGVSVLATPHGEEHYHHYYIEPVPYGVTPIHPPVILPGGHTGHSQFSLYSPVIDAELKYRHYWDLPPHTFP